MCDVCGPEPANKKQARWWRHEYFQRHGAYPKKPQAPQAAAAAHPVISSQFIGDTNLSKQYDENGQPWEDHRND